MGYASISRDAAMADPAPAALDMPRNIWTDRLRLRPLHSSDTAVVFNEFCSDPRVTRYMEWKTHSDPSETAQFIGQVHAGEAQNLAWYWGIAQRRGGRLVGMMGCTLHQRRLVMGYLLSVPNWGKGYATEAGSALIDRLGAIDGIDGIDAILASCHTENTGSMRVLDKLGFERKGIIQCVCPNIDALPKDLYWYRRQPKAPGRSISAAPEQECAHECS